MFIGWTIPLLPGGANVADEPGEVKPYVRHGTLRTCTCCRPPETQSSQCFLAIIDSCKPLFLKDHRYAKERVKETSCISYSDIVNYYTMVIRSDRSSPRQRGIPDPSKERFKE